MDIQRYTDVIAAYATDLGVKILAAIAFWIIGRWLIRFAGRLLQRAMGTQKIDATLMRYVGSIVSVTLNIVLIVAILGYFGVQTTTFAALVAGVGIAVGAAWGGLLSNFAAGAFLMVLKPFKVGDAISAGGSVGTVREIGLFATTIDTPDNVMTIVGNAKIFGDTIQNFSANAYRRVDLKCQIAGDADHAAAMQLLRDRMQKVPNVLAEPRVEVDILEFSAAGPVLAVRPYCHNAHYWQVYFEGNRVMREALAEAGFPAPMPTTLVLSRSA
jgi:small conductance mechanosensitive channel